MHFTRTAITGILTLLLSAPAFAVYKCKKPDGSVAFQDSPCPNDSQGEKVKVAPPNAMGPAADRPDHIRAAIAARRPAVGMTLAELERAIGKPEKVNAAQYGSDFKDQLVYYTETRTIYVYTTNGVVTSIQNSEGGRPRSVPNQPYSPPPKSCPSEAEISDIEFETRKTSNRDKPQVLAELYRQLKEARACTRN